MTLVAWIPLHQRKHVTTPSVMLSMGTGAVLGAFYGLGEGVAWSAVAVGLALLLVFGVRGIGKRWPGEPAAFRLVALAGLTTILTRLAAAAWGY